MEILLENNKITIGEYNSQLSNVSFITSENRDSVTFQFFSGFEKTIRVSETRVNGVQMTSDNIDQLLTPIFATRVANDSSAESAESPQPYTQSDWSDPLLFPSPLRSGHIVEFYKGEALQEAYQFNGFFWDLLSMKPNLAYKLADGIIPPNTVNDGGVVFAKLSGANQYMAIKEGAELTASIETSRLLEIDNSYIVQNLNYYVTDDQQQVDIDNLKIRSFSLTAQNYTPDHTLALELNIKNTLIGSVMAQVALNEVAISDCNSIFEDSGIGYMNFNASNVLINNCDINDLSISLVKPSADADSVSTNISKNRLRSGLNINAQYYAEKLNYSIPLSLTENRGLVSLNISGLSYLGTIDNSRFDFDESTLESINLSEVSFSDSALEALVKALTEKTFTKPNRNFSAYGINLSADQKTRLQNAGWVVYNS